MPLAKRFQGTKSRQLITSHRTAEISESHGILKVNNLHQLVARRHLQR